MVALVFFNLSILVLCSIQVVVYTVQGTVSKQTWLSTHINQKTLHGCRVGTRKEGFFFLIQIQILM